MRLTDFAIGKVRRRRRSLRFRLLLGLSIKSTPAVYYALRRCTRSTNDILRIMRRVRHIRSVTFNLNVYSDEQGLRDFRFRPREIGRIADVIGFHAETTRRCGYCCDLVTAACIVMRRLASPCRWHDLEDTFGMRYYVLSEVFWEALEGFIEGHGHLLQSFRHDLMTERAHIYAESITAQGSPLDSCVGFIDCTKIQMHRPGALNANQRVVYSGHKRSHCLVYQSISTPDGLIFHMFGPEVGRRHDITLYRQAGMDDILRDSLLIDDRQFYIYGDPAYILRPWLQVAFNTSFSNASHLNHNASMSSVRESVEWSYKDLKQMWTSQDYKRMLKVRKARVSLMYIGAALLWNFKVCLQHGGEVQSYFCCPPPSLSRYLEQNL